MAPQRIQLIVFEEACSARAPDPRQSAKLAGSPVGFPQPLFSDTCDSLIVTNTTFVNHARMRQMVERVEA